ncbi:uncharacterized protein LTR77_008564 [Saxophila tyrrhenica]|uniref:Fun14 family protein n=1 Tax=Saxophila tyrrhenica TaxID=1690608 RepID=A0AAV9P5C5_9PEZI|nr:hypothetical protein LTR77_008564 [Saxophila tyrrhenica]
MASRLFHPSLFHLRSPLFAASFGVSSAIFGASLLQAHRSRYAYRLDSSPSSTSAKDWSFSQYQSEARTPVVSQNGGLNARAVRQMSAGSIFGLVAGLGLSIFSKPLVVLVGLLIAGVQTAESYGVHLVPYRQLQGYVKNVDLRSAVQDNVAFKVSFGLMFALSAFAEF